MIRKNVPNFVTTLNLLSGCFSIVFAFDGNLLLASWFIGLAAVFDFLDGMLARLLNARSPLGLQLDSLADVISFGMAPGVIVFQLMLNATNLPAIYWNEVNLAAMTAFLIPAFSAIRLAKFNIDDRQTNSFIGLPTPANAIFFASLPLVFHQAEVAGHQWIMQLLQNFPLLLVITILFSLLLVAPIPLLAFKFKTYRFSDNLVRYIFISLAIILFFAIKFYALPILIGVYILLTFVLKSETGK